GVAGHRSATLAAGNASVPEMLPASAAGVNALKSTMIPPGTPGGASWMWAAVAASNRSMKFTLSVMVRAVESKNAVPEPEPVLALGGVSCEPSRLMVNDWSARAATRAHRHTNTGRTFFLAIIETSLFRLQTTNGRPECQYRTRQQISKSSRRRR